jgi:hypothetical protein
MKTMAKYGNEAKTLLNLPTLMVSEGGQQDVL